jgi:hypothetical protein
MSASPEMVNIAAAADYLAVSELMVLRMIRYGRLVGYVDLAQVDALMQPIGSWADSGG